MQVNHRAAYRGRTGDLFITSSILARLDTTRRVQNCTSDLDHRPVGTAWEWQGLSPLLSPLLSALRRPALLLILALAAVIPMRLIGEQVTS